ncbi:hypothetical protein VNI00_019386 [Paramarasmius palmivorus]|uniref:VHS domain-containing protein n=1 Tax=Paramarasmius palmivorus TaxID=297713 RepID=A0AAW0ALN9_9AGAR
MKKDGGVDGSELETRRKEKDHSHRDRGRWSWQLVGRRDEETPGELTRCIGYLVATGGEDWALVLDVCERASSSEIQAKEAVLALRREFKYDTLEDLLASSKTSPVVRERMLDILAGAAYASASKKDTGFRGLWKKVKPHDKPDEGVPFDTNDAMFNPPVVAAANRPSMVDLQPLLNNPSQTSISTSTSLEVHNGKIRYDG